MDKVLVGHSNGTIRIISTIYPNLSNIQHFNFVSEGISNSIKCIACSADSVFTGSTSGVSLHES